MSFTTSPKNIAVLGVYDYNDSGSTVNYTNIGNYETINNDGLGSFTNKAGALPSKSDIYNTSTNRFDWSGLSIGDTVDIRLDIEVTTTSANQEVDIDLELGIGGFAYDLPLFGYVKIVTAGTYRLPVPIVSVYMGDSNTLDNSARLKLKSNANTNYVVNGWYCRVIKKES